MSPIQRIISALITVAAISAACVHSFQATATERIAPDPAVAQQIATLSAAGNPDDSVPVIIVLRQTSRETASSSRTEIAANRALIAQSAYTFKKNIRRFFNNSAVVHLFFLWSLVDSHAVI